MIFRKFFFWLFLVFALSFSIFLFGIDSQKYKADIFEVKSDIKSFNYAITNNGETNFVVTDEFDKFLGIKNIFLISPPIDLCSKESVSFIDYPLLTFLPSENSLAYFWFELDENTRYICGAKYDLSTNIWGKSYVIVDNDRILGDFKVSQFEENKLVIIYRKKFCSHISLVGRTLSTLDFENLKVYGDKTTTGYSCRKFYASDYEFPIADYLNKKYGEITDYDIDENSIIIEYRNEFSQNSSLWITNLNPSGSKTPRKLKRYDPVYGGNNNFHNPRIATSIGGTKMIVWSSKALAGGSDWDVFGGFLDKNLEKFSGDTFFKINEYVGKDQKDIGVFWNKDKFVTFYLSNSALNSPQSLNLVARPFDVVTSKSPSKESILFSKSFGVINNIEKIVNSNGKISLILDTDNKMTLIDLGGLNE